MKPIGKKKPVASPPWHPDFRDATALPDVKLIRTSFFVNAGSVCLLAVALLLLASHEMKRRSLNSEIADLEANLRENKARHEEVLRLHQEFEKREKLIVAVSQVVDNSLDLSRFLVALGHSLRPGMSLSNIRYTEQGQQKLLQINGSIYGSPDAAASEITDYLEVFKVNPVLSERVEAAVPVSLVPTPDGDLMAFGIELRLKSPKKAAKKTAG